MSESIRIWKWIAIGLATAEFLYGLILSLMILLMASWFDADPSYDDRALWPSAWAIVAAAVVLPPVFGYVAERTAKARTLAKCLAVLISYPVLIASYHLAS